MWREIDRWVSFAARWIAVLGVAAALVTTAGGWAGQVIDEIIDGRIKRAIAAHEAKHPVDAVLPPNTVIMTDKDCADVPGWAAYTRAAGRLPVGAGAGVDINGVGREFRVDVEDTLGEYEHTLTVPELPAHSHMFHIGKKGGGWRRGSGPKERIEESHPTGTTGENMAHNNMPPTFAMNFCIRIAGG